MARHLRTRAPGLFRHVMARGNGRMPIFLDDTDYRAFISLLGGTAEELDIECWHYCVMPNHYHATLRPLGDNLSDGIRRLNSGYAQWWNRRHGRVGHVFQGRFKDQLVQEDGYLLALGRYIALNPVRAGLVTTPEAWAWSSYAATIGLSPVPSFLRVDAALRLFGPGERRLLQARFAEHATAKPTAAGVCGDDRIRSSERILGSLAFKRELSAAIVAQ